MSRILVVAYKDQDITDGLKKLIAASSLAISEIVYPEKFEALSSAVQTVAEEFDLATTTVTGSAESLEGIRQDDTLAFVWDDTPQIHTAYVSVEDYGCSAWDVSDGLASIETAPEVEDTEAELVDAFLNLMEVMTDYITDNVLAMVEHTLYHVEHDEDE